MTDLQSQASSHHSEGKDLPDFSVAALGVSLSVALANTPTVGRLLSTIPIAS